MSSGSVVLFGGSGMLGQAFRQFFEARQRSVFAPSSSEIDIRDASRVERSIPLGALVVNCAAWTDVDGAERDEAAALRLNAEAVANLARACVRARATLLHFSTDYVFDGASNAPYRVEAPTNPINAYGRSKLAGEEAIRDIGGDYLVVRTSWLYASWGKNFLRTIASKARQVQTLRVVSDQVGRPTWVCHLAETSVALLGHGARGLFHVADGGQPCSWFDFAKEVVHCMGVDCSVSPCGTADYPSPTTRPPFSAMDLSAAETLVGCFPDWREHTARVCAELST